MDVNNNQYPICYGLANEELERTDHHFQYFFVNMCAGKNWVFA